MPKKEFKINPAMQYLSAESINNFENNPSAENFNKNYGETKSKRLQLLIKPSTFNKVKSIADDKQLSVNELINQILEQYDV